MLRRVLGVGSTGLLASQLAVHAMPLDSSWSRSRVSLAQSAQPDQRPVVICGPSGVGKGTLLTRLMAEHPDSFGFSVSHTTRQSRAGEVDGVHYHFVDKEKFLSMKKKSALIELACVWKRTVKKSASLSQMVKQSKASYGELIPKVLR